MKTIYSFSLAILLAAVTAKAQLSVSVYPVQDAYFLSMGGGMGANTMLKFDISAVPAGATITGAVLEVYVWDTVGPQSFNPNASLGNMRFMNLHNHQGWTESDSTKFFNPFQNTFSDTVNQLTGFGDTIGWATSDDLSGIVLYDFNLGNQFCTIFMKDTDDVTCCSGPGPFLTNSPDTLMTGNKIVGGDQIMFYPREKANYAPKLTIMYSCSVSSSQNLTICSYDSVMVGSNMYNTTGTYVDTLTAQNGCDSVVTTNLTVKPALDLSVTVTSNTITANENGASYQWIDCNNNNAAIGGATSQSYAPTNAGDYAVVITKNGCSDTSGCSNITFTGVHANSNLVRAYPNPVKDVLSLELTKMYEVTLCDVTGRTVYHTAVSGKIFIDMKNEVSGLYLLKLTNEHETKMIRIVKD